MSIPNDGSKERTLSHMNKDHQHDLSAIMQHQLGVACSSPVLTDISLSTLTITTTAAAANPSQPQPHIIPISPPMSSWSDRRARLVDLTLDARRALNLDAKGQPLVVKTFLPPSGFGAVVFAGVVFYFSAFAAVKVGLVEPGTQAWRALELVRFPGGAEGFKKVVGRIFWSVVAIHVGECWWLWRSRLSRYKVEGAVWWAWMGRCFLEGFTSFGSFDEVVEGLRKGE
ncbi:hypothetical protein GE09DRAFT_57479 [Coniochaeta sp. 2T2.1]|nr:hypothetical protein GE09DRAFT_57479 [Coniochaeta sp. 2T2.1]